MKSEIHLLNLSAKDLNARNIDWGPKSRNYLSNELNSYASLFSNWFDSTYLPFGLMDYPWMFLILQPIFSWTSFQNLFNIERWIEKFRNDLVFRTKQKKSLQWMKSNHHRKAFNYHGIDLKRNSKFHTLFMVLFVYNLNQNKQLIHL